MLIGSLTELNSDPRLQVCGGWDCSLWADGEDLSGTDELGCRSHDSSPVRWRPQQAFSRVRGALNRSCSVPDSNNPPCLSTSAHGSISVPVYDLTEIGAAEHTSRQPAWSLDGGRRRESSPVRSLEGCERDSSSGRQLEPSGEQRPPDPLGAPSNYMTKSMLSLNEEFQDEVRRGPVSARGGGGDRMMQMWPSECTVR